jgi:hypothetical protein
VGLLVLGLLIPVTAQALAGGPPARGAARPRSVLEGAPGYYPPNDPESLSVVRGRRQAKPVTLAFRGGRRSVQELARAVVSALEDGDRKALQELCVTEEEFRVILWPEFPQSRPATGATAEDGWYFLTRRNQGGVDKALQELGGRRLDLVHAERAGDVAAYRNFRLHHDVRIVVRNERGQEDTLAVIRSVAERKGVFKIYSLRD